MVNSSDFILYFSDSPSSKMDFLILAFTNGDFAWAGVGSAWLGFDFDFGLWSRACQLGTVKVSSVSAWFTCTPIKVLGAP